MKQSDRGSRSKITAADVARVLRLDELHTPWLKNLDEVQPSVSLMFPGQDEISLLLARLGVEDEDAREVLRTMPSARQEPEVCWLLERSHHILASRLANRETAASAKPTFQAPQGMDWTTWSQSLPATLRFFSAHLILATASAIRECHKEFGIPDDISWKTLSYLGRAMKAYRQSHGEAGIHLTRWDWLRFLGWLYEVGRLEVTHYRIRTYPKEAGPLFWYDEEAIARLGPGFRKGDPALSVHVPANEPLAPDAFSESLNRMRNDFMRVYPGERMRVATCTSWLLDEQLAEYLPADSNILAFQSRFTLVPGARDDKAIVRAVFGNEKPKDLDSLPQRTTLERAVVQHLRQGRSWRLRTGWLDL